MKFLAAALFALNGLVALASGLPPEGGMSALGDTGEMELSAFENKLLRGVHANTDMLKAISGKLEGSMKHLEGGELELSAIENMAGPGNDPVQVYRTKLRLHWEFLRLWTGFELPSSWVDLPAYGLNLNRNSFCVMRWPQIDLVAQDLNDIQRPKSFQKIAGREVLDEYYNSHLRK
jgi:hypothetical protein